MNNTNSSVSLLILESQNLNVLSPLSHSTIISEATHIDKKGLFFHNNILLFLNLYSIFLHFFFMKLLFFKFLFIEFPTVIILMIL